MHIILLESSAGYAGNVAVASADLYGIGRDDSAIILTLV